MSKNIVAGTLLLLTALSSGLAGERAPTFSTPQQAFEAARGAAQKGDWKGVCATLTDESRDALAGALAVLPSMYKAMARRAGPKEKAVLDKLRPLALVLAKHGLSEKTFNNLLAERAGAADKDEAIKLALPRLLAPVRDRCAFIADMFDALKKVDEKQAARSPIAANAQLKDVTLDGDTAKGVIVTRVPGGRDRRDPIAFRRRAGSWKIDLPFGPGKQSGKRPPSGK
jgi:hypothetical protein